MDQELVDELARRFEAALRAHVTPKRRLLTVEDAAEYLGRTPRAVEMLIQRGRIKVVKIDSRTQIDAKYLDKLIDENTL